MTKLNQFSRSCCPISGALDIIGDKWTLLIVRDLIFFCKRYYGDFQNSPEKIATNILSDRLKRLEECNIISRRQDPANARKVIYMPTEKCLDLVPLIMEMVCWGAKHTPGSNAHEDLIQRFQQDRAGFIAEIHQSLRLEMK